MSKAIRVNKYTEITNDDINSIVVVRPDNGGFPYIVDSNTGLPVRYMAALFEGAGWTVVKVLGSRRTNRIVKRIEGMYNQYTMHQAQIVASNLYNEKFRF